MSREPIEPMAAKANAARAIMNKRHYKKFLMEIISRPHSISPIVDNKTSSSREADQTYKCDSALFKKYFYADNSDLQQTSHQLEILEDTENITFHFTVPCNSN